MLNLAELEPDRADLGVAGVSLCRPGALIISTGALAHVGCQPAGSVIGQNARIFADFSVPRAIRLRVMAGPEVALC
jgi:hypothetical protein